MRDEYGNEKHAGTVTASRQYTYASPNDAPMEIGKVLGIAGGAAGALAGLWVLLSEREKKQEPKTAIEQAKAMLEEAANRAREEGSHAQASLMAGLEGLTSDTKKKGKASKKTAAKSSKKAGKKAGADASETIDKIAQFLKEAREEAAAIASSEADKVGAAARKKADEARKASKSYSNQAKKDADRAKGELSGIAGMLKSRLADAEQAAEEYVGDVVVPKVRELGHDAREAIELGKDKSEELLKKAESDVLPEAKKRAEELRKAGEHLIPEAKKVAEDVRKKAEAELLPEARKKAEALGHTVEVQAKTAKKSIESGVDAVEHQAATAGEAVKRGGRETKSLLLWVALAGVLIFTVFLDEEQQNRLKEIAVELFGEARDMYSDMKGEDTFQA